MFALPCGMLTLFGSQNSLVTSLNGGDVFDGVFATTGGEMLEELAGDGCPAAFMPNPVEGSIERFRAFENPDPEFDLVFWGSDRHAPERARFLQSIIDALPELRFGVFGVLPWKFRACLERKKKT